MTLFAFANLNEFNLHSNGKRKEKGYVMCVGLRIFNYVNFWVNTACACNKRFV